MRWPGGCHLMRDVTGKRITDVAWSRGIPFNKTRGCDIFTFPLVSQLKVSHQRNCLTSGHHPTGWLQGVGILVQLYASVYISPQIRKQAYATHKTLLALKRTAWRCHLRWRWDIGSVSSDKATPAKDWFRKKELSSLGWALPPTFCWMKFIWNNAWEEHQHLLVLSLKEDSCCAASRQLAFCLGEETKNEPKLHKKNCTSWNHHLNLFSKTTMFAKSNNQIKQFCHQNSFATKEFMPFPACLFLLLCTCIKHEFLKHLHINVKKRICFAQKWKAVLEKSNSFVGPWWCMEAQWESSPGWGYLRFNFSEDASVKIQYDWEEECFLCPWFGSPAHCFVALRCELKCLNDTVKKWVFKQIRRRKQVRSSCVQEVFPHVKIKQKTCTSSGKMDVCFCKILDLLVQIDWQCVHRILLYSTATCRACTALMWLLVFFFSATPLKKF